MKRPAYSKLELSKMTDDELVSVADEKMKVEVLRRTNKFFDVKMQRRPDESAGEFLVRQREASKINKAEHPKLLRRNLEAAILNSPDNVNQAKADKMFSGWKMSETERAELDARMAERERQSAMRDMENGRSFTAGPVAMPAEWDGEAPAKAKPAQAPAPAPRAATNPTRPSPSRKSRK